VPDATHETWLPVPGYPDYEVSDLGRVRSNRPFNGIPQHHRILRPAISHGYPQVTLHNGEPRRIWRVHRLVLLAFVGPCPPGQEVRHGPGGKMDARLVNLCYGTRAENIADRERDGGQRRVGPRGERNSHAKLNPAIAADIRRRVAAGESRVEVARSLGVGKSTIVRVVLGQCWADGLVS
jgi:hypothetical protein